MQKAKQAVQDFVSHDGKQKTTVHEDSRQAITEEHVKPHTHENITTAVDKDVHQDHHHTTIQPVTAKEVLPEQHQHNVIPVEHKTFNHGNDKDTKANLEREAAQFQNTSQTHSTTHSASAAPVVAGERTHHHVHEHVQPVIQKETVAPKVVHTTIPVHETHHAGAVHHGTSVLPTETLESFNAGNKGVLGGRAATKVGEFDGPPKSYNNELQHGSGDRTNLTGNHTDHTHNSTHNNAVGSGVGAGGLGHDNTHSHSSTAGGVGGLGHDNTNTHNTTGGVGGATRETRSGVAGTQQTTGKPSLMDKLNPSKDADGDGKKGFMK